MDKRKIVGLGIYLVQQSDGWCGIPIWKFSKNTEDNEKEIMMDRM